MSSNLVKLPFSILAVSGYEENYPPEGLIDQAYQSQGWQTERFCIFPQSIILAFNFGKCRIRKIQLLINEFKIPKKIDFFAGNVDSDNRDQTSNGIPTIEFHRLGFINLNDNSQNSFKSRELKSIHVDFEATHLKISLHKNFINTLNLYNQVGIVAITLLGEVMDTDYLVRTMSKRNGLHYGLDNTLNKDSIVKGFINQDAIDKRIPFIHDLSFDFYQDAKMIKFISAVSDAKLEAVKLENFEVAKALKIVLNNAKNASTKIIQIKMEKEKYIQAEDYDEAQRCKTEIEDIKLSLIERLESFGMRIDQNGVIYSESMDRKDSALELTKSNLSITTSLRTSSDSVISKAENPSSSSLPAVANRVQSPQGKHPAGDALIVVISEPIKPTASTLLEEKTSNTQAVSNDDPRSLSPQQHKKAVLARTGSPLLPAQQKLLEEGTRDESILEKPKSPLLEPPPKITRTGSPLLPAQEKMLNDGLLDQKVLEKPKSPPESKLKPMIARTGSPLLPAQQKLLSKNGNNPEFETNISSKPDTFEVTKEKSKAQMSNVKNTPKDLSEPEALSAFQLEQFAACIDVFQLFVVQHTLSINFKCREYGLAEISNKIIEWSKQGKSSSLALSSLCKATMQLVGCCLEDSREKSSLLTLSVVKQLLETVAQDGGDDSQIYNSFTNSINSLISKAGDSNPRIKSNASEILKKMLKLYHKPPYSLLHELVKPFEKKKGGVIHPKIMKSRLEILNFAISEYGISDQGDKFGSTSIMSFIAPLVENTNSEVRDLAYTIVAQICINEGESYTKEYTNKIRDAQKEILTKKIASLGGVKNNRNPSAKSTKKEDKEPKSSKKKETELKTPVTKKEAKEPKSTKNKESEAIAKKEDKEPRSSKKKETELKTPVTKKEDKEPKSSKKKETELKTPVTKKEDKEPKSTKNKESESIAKKEDKDPKNSKKKETKEKKPHKKTTFSDETENDSKKPKSSSQETCLFCEKSIKMTNQDSLEQHYTKDCPFLVECPQCTLMVEIMLLQTHMYGSCESSPSDPKSCDRCHLLIPSIDFVSHRSKKKCKVWNIDHDPSICGICKKSIMGKSGWKVHVLYDKKCISKRKKD